MILFYYVPTLLCFALRLFPASFCNAGTGHPQWKINIIRKGFAKMRQLKRLKSEEKQQKQNNRPSTNASKGEYFGIFPIKAS